MKTNVITHKLDGNIIEPNTNDGNVKIILRPNSKNPNAAPIIETNSWNFPFEVAQTINARVAAGGFGVTEGPIYSQEITDENGTLELYKAALDLMGGNIVWSCEAIENIEGYLYGDLRWLSEISKSVMFRDLDLKEHYIQIPYVDSDLPDYNSAAIATLTAFVVLSKVFDITIAIAKIVAELISIISAIAALLKIILVFLWGIIILALIIVLLADILRHLVQPVKYHASMLLRTLLKVGCAEIGLGFESSVFLDPVMENAVVLPAKPEAAKDENNRFSLGFTLPNFEETNGEPISSLFELIETFLLAYHAEATVSDGVLHLEPKAIPNDDPVYELPDLPNLPDDPHRTNLKADYNSSYEVSFEEDLTDPNTTNNYKGTKVIALTKPIDVNDILAVIGGNSVKVPIPWARGFRKLALTNIEKQLDVFFKSHSDAINDLIGVANVAIELSEAILPKVEGAIIALKVVGINIPFSAQPIAPILAVTPDQIEQRIGMLLGRDAFSKDKLISLVIGSTPFLTKVREDNAEKIAAKNFYNTYHFIQSLEVTDANPTGSQFNIYKHPAFHLCKESAEEIIRNKRIFTFDKRSIAQVASCGWFAEEGIAEIEIKIPTLITDNFETTLIEPNGL